MTGGRRLHAALGAVGVLSWAFYLLGCGWTAWSPDGSKVLVLYTGADDVSALVVDVRSGRAKPLASVSPADESFAFGQWDRSGKRIIVSNWRKAGLSVLVVPVGASAPTREFRVDAGRGGDAYPVPPPYPQIGGDLFVGGESLHRLNLETGATASKELPEKTDGVMLFQRGERVGYLADPKSDGPFVVGEVDRADLSLRAAFEFRVDKLRPDGAKLELGPWIAVAPSGERVAMTARSEDGRDAIIVLKSNGVERLLVPELPKGHRLGNLQWSRDGRALYAATLGPTAEKGVVQYSAGIIPLGNEAPRLIALARLRVDTPSADLPDSWEVALRVSLSPDGRALATHTGVRVDHLEPLDGAAVYILNLDRRAVRRIDLPKRPRESGSEKKEHRG